jgi:prophage DNA circulation protein
MSWRDNLQKASFRNAEFFVESADGELGQRVVLHEYPLRDTSYAEDLGQKARQYTLELYVLGSGYMRARDRLIEALNEPGPGTLIHPYLGSIHVAVLNARGPRESTRQGGMARFSVTFAAAGKNRQPDAVKDTAGIVRARAGKIEETLQSGFERGFSVDGLPDHVAASGRDICRSVLDKLDAIRRKLPGVPDVATDFVRSLQHVSSRLTDLVRYPGDLAVELLGLFNDFAGLVSAPADAMGMYQQLYEAFGRSDDAEGISAFEPMAKAAIRRNAAEVKLFVRGATVISAVGVCVEADFNSADQAVNVRDRLCALIDAEMLEVEDGGLFSDLMELRSVFVADIEVRQANLQRIVHHTPAVTLPALVLAYQLYGDAGRDAEIVGRNKIAHPLFVPGGRSLEVLSAV